MPDSPQALRLPEGLLSTGDPCEKNPFSTDDVRYQIWEDATRKAETGLCQLNSDFMKGVPTDMDARIQWEVAVVAGKYDIWACRNMRVVLTDADAVAFGQWLFAYANSWLDAESGRSFPFARETVLTSLRVKLIERMEHWKGEARTYVAKQKAHEQRVEAGLLRVHSKKLEGAKLMDCLREACDVFAGSFAKAGQELTEELLNQAIPSLVFRAAIRHKWIPYPLVRPVGRRVVGNFLEGWYDRSRSRCVVVPEKELTETFAGYKVTAGYEAAFKRILEGRVAFWRAEVMTHAAGGLPRAAQAQQAHGQPATAEANQAESNRAPATSTEASKESNSTAPLTVRPTAGDRPAAVSQRPYSDWEGIEIRFLSDHQIQVRDGGKIEPPLGYEVLGFADHRNGLPSQEWATFLRLAKGRGIIRDDGRSPNARAGREWLRMQKRIERIRKKLTERFHIAGDPVPYVPGTGYRAVFRIGCAPAFSADDKDGPDGVLGKPAIKAFARQPTGARAGSASHKPIICRKCGKEMPDKDVELTSAHCRCPDKQPSEM